MHMAQSVFAKGEVGLTIDYRTNAGTQRLQLVLTGDEAKPPKGKGKRESLKM